MEHGEQMMLERSLSGIGNRMRRQIVVFTAFVDDDESPLLRGTPVDSSVSGIVVTSAMSRVPGFRRRLPTRCGKINWDRL